MVARALVLDHVSALNFKRVVEQPHGLAPSWVPPADLRRLAAYKVRAAYIENNARHYLPDSVGEAERTSHREYGDPRLLVNRAVAGVLGDSVEIVVEGADEELPDVPELPDEPEDPGEAASRLERTSYDAQRRVWEQRATETIEEWEQAWAERPALQAHQEWMRKWAGDELLRQRLWEGEQKAVGIADAVYELGLDREVGRPKIRVHDPGFYFPVLDDEAERRGFPTRVHLAWEVDLDDDGTADHVRRITYELGPIAGQTGEDGSVSLRDGDSLTEGRITRRYPWAPDEDSAITCYVTDATWPFDALGERRVDDFAPDRATYARDSQGQELRQLDLGIDFLPVIHVPNTPEGQEHFGRSILDAVLQLFDDISDSDSDLQSAAGLAGTPMIGVSGADMGAQISVSPGTALKLGEKGSLTTVDMSHNVEVLRDVIDDLLERLFTNVQVPGALLGRLSESEGRSGVWLRLRFSPFAQLIGLLRLVREPKYALLLKFAARLAQAGGYLEKGVLPAARLAFGPFLPEDQAGVVEMVVKLLAAKAISVGLALRLLDAAGVEVGSIEDELRAIQHTDFEGAGHLLDALGSDEVVADYLGREAPDNPEAPPVEIEVP
jgi:hypothetical protein